MAESLPQYCEGHDESSYDGQASSVTSETSNDEDPQSKADKSDNDKQIAKFNLETLFISDSRNHKKSQFDEYLLIIPREPPPDLIVNCFAQLKFWKETFELKPSAQFVHLEETYVHHPKATILFANLLMKSYSTSVIKLTLGVHRETSDLMLSYQMMNLLCLEVVFISQNIMTAVFKGCPRLKVIRFSSYIKDRHQPLRPPDWSLMPDSMMEINCLSSFHGLSGLFASSAGKKLQVLGGISVIGNKLTLDYQTVLTQLIACIEGGSPQESLDQVTHIVSQSPSLEDLMVAFETSDTETLDWTELFKSFNTGKNLGVMSLEQEQELPLTEEQIVQSTQLASLLKSYLPNLKNLLWAFPITFDGLAMLSELREVTELTIPRFYPHPHKRFCCLMFYIDEFCRRDSFESFSLNVDGNIAFPKRGFKKVYEERLNNFCKEQGLQLIIKTSPCITENRHVRRTTTGKVIRYLRYLEISRTPDSGSGGYPWKSRKSKRRSGI